MGAVCCAPSHTEEPPVAAAQTKPRGDAQNAKKDKRRRKSNGSSSSIEIEVDVQLGEEDDESTARPGATAETEDEAVNNEADAEAVSERHDAEPTAEPIPNEPIEGVTPEAPAAEEEMPETVETPEIEVEAVEGVKFKFGFGF